MLATACLLPWVQRFRLRTHTSGFRKGQYSLSVTALWVLAMLGLVAVWSSLSPAVLPTPRLELLAFGVLISLSQILHWRRLGRHYATADLT